MRALTLAHSFSSHWPPARLRRRLRRAEMSLVYAASWSLLVFTRSFIVMLVRAGPGMKQPTSARLSIRARIPLVKNQGQLRLFEPEYSYTPSISTSFPHAGRRVTKTPLSPSAYTSSRLSVLMRMGGKQTLQSPKRRGESQPSKDQRGCIDLSGLRTYVPEGVSPLSLLATALLE